jgi:acetyl-CoA acyltransferase
VIAGARTIRDGADVIIVGGVESMSRAPFVHAQIRNRLFARAGRDVYDTTIGWRFINQRIAKAHGIESMPETAENVASEHRHFSCQIRTPYALRVAKERYDAGLAPRRYPARDPPIPAAATAVVDRGRTPPRHHAGKAWPPFPPRSAAGGTVTAGNAAGINDGAAGVILIASAEGRPRSWPAPQSPASGAAASRRGRPPRSWASAPLPPWSALSCPGPQASVRTK